MQSSLLLLNLLYHSLCSLLIYSILTALYPSSSSLFFAGFIRFISFTSDELSLSSWKQAR